MESYSTSYSSSNKSPYLSQNTKQAKGQKHAYPLKSHSLLHSVRQSNAKPWKKMPVAPMPPTPVKVYKVDPLNFRELVQQLTGAPEFKPQQEPHHQLVQTVTSSAATSLDVAAASPPVSTNWYQDFQSELFGVKTQGTTTTDGAMTPGFLDMSLSPPSSYSNWCFFPLLSPGTMISMEPGRVL